ncbi:MAG: class I SAM-dependent methyltransferase [Candidatus Binatia bacterium]
MRDGRADRDAHAPSAPLRVSPGDAGYAQQARLEAEFWGRSDFSVVSLTQDAPPWAVQAGNRLLTGRADTHWLDDLMARGPFLRAAALGCNEALHEAAWLSHAPGARLDVYEISETVIRKVRNALRTRRFGISWPRHDVRFIQADLNFVRLPRAAYDIVWSCGCLHHVINLEHLFAEVEATLRPGGIFAFNDYVGERRLQFAPERLEVINEVLQRVPPRFRGTADRIERPAPEWISPFCAVRSDEILPLAEARFSSLHLGRAGALFPLTFRLDLNAIGREAPELAAYLDEAEAAAARRFQPCGVYAVFQKAS